MKRKQQAETSREALVQAARECFAKQGYEATTVGAVLARAGMARGALYHYFPDGKRQLFEAVFERVNDAFHERRDAATELPSPLARIRAGIRVFLQLCTEDEFARIALVDAPRLVPGQAERGSSYRLLHAQLEQACRQGEVDAGEPELLALALYGAVRSAGEFIATAEDRAAAVGAATRALDRMLDGWTGG